MPSSKGQRQVFDVAVLGPTSEDESERSYEQRGWILDLIQNSYELLDGIGVGRTEYLGVRGADIMDACEPAGQWLRKGKPFRPTRQFGSNYWLVNLRPAIPNDYNWDPDHTLFWLVLLSHAIRPSSFGLRYCARVVIDPNGDTSILAPHDYQPVYPLRGRGWLNRDEWRTAASLFVALRASSGERKRLLEWVLLHLWRLNREWTFEYRWLLLILLFESTIPREWFGLPFWRRDRAYQANI